MGANGYQHSLTSMERSIALDSLARGSCTAKTGNRACRYVGNWDYSPGPGNLSRGLV